MRAQMRPSFRGMASLSLTTYTNTGHYFYSYGLEMGFMITIFVAYKDKYRSKKWEKY